MANGEIVLYTVEDGSTIIKLRAEGDTVWLTQAEIATLFQTTPQNITLHVKAIYRDQELQAQATCKELLQVQPEGSRNESSQNFGLEKISIKLIPFGVKLRRRGGYVF